MIIRPISVGLAMLTLACGSSAALANSSFSDINKPSSVVLLEYAQAGESPRREKKRKGVLEQLNLSSQQQQQISTIRQKYRPNMEQVRTRLRTARQELQQLMVGDATKDNIRAKHQQVGELHQELDTLRFESMLEIRDVLTTAQRQELDRMMQQRRTRMSDRMGDRPEPPEEL
jgi:periplasmic protein CpxP/Spy